MDTLQEVVDAAGQDCLLVSIGAKPANGSCPPLIQCCPCTASSRAAAVVEPVAIKTSVEVESQATMEEEMQQLEPEPAMEPEEGPATIVATTSGTIKRRPVQLRV